MQEKEIRWKTSLSLFSIYLCLFIFLIGCDGPGIPDPPEPEPVLPPVSDRLVARIYFDATLSMQGFVVPGSTHYTRICPSLESVIVSGWTDGKADFYRFGEQVESINRGTYLQAGTTDFYEDKTINRETFIQKIIDHEGQFVSNQVDESNMSEKSAEIEESSTSEESTEVATSTEEVNESEKEKPLVVIVTDLFQDRSDINLLVTQLKEKYIKNGLEVGLFGLRSQFDGIVYDTGIGTEPLPHKSNLQDPKTFRPFYLLVLGRHADIAHYFDLLKANNPDAKTIIFSRYLVDSLLSIDGDLIKPELDNLNEVTLKSVPPHVKQFRIVDDSIPAGISAKLAYDGTLRHAMFFDADTFEPSIMAKDKLMEKTKENPEARECLQVKPTLSKNEDGNELTVDFELDLQSLRGEAIYLYEVTLSPNVDEYQAPEWCSNWDMGTERDGAQTLNLVNFVSQLSQVTARRHHPKIAKFHFYIEKR